MGYSISWLACKGRERGVLQRELGVLGTGDFGEYGDLPLVGTTLPSAWYLLVADRCDAELISEQVLSSVSENCSAIACSIEEHVMFSAAAFWNNGRKVWEVSHRGEFGPRDLKVVGTPPGEFDGIRDALTAKQDEERGEPSSSVDWFFEMPLSLAKQITGFKHDEEMVDLAGGRFEVLRPEGDGLLAKAAKRWWRFWR
jgi:hypothetical protein